MLTTSVPHENFLVTLICTAVILLGCSPQSETAVAAESGSNASTLATEPTKYVYLRDNKTGLNQSRSPVPESWQVFDPQAPVYLSSAKGLKVYKTEMSQFAWSNDPFMRQSMQMAGGMLAAPASIEQILEGQVRPSLESQGYRFLGAEAVPGVEGLWQRLFVAMPDTGNRRSVRALATDWESPDGSRSMILMVRTETAAPQQAIWQLYTTELEAPAGHFAEAKSAYLYALAATELNPEWLAASNQALLRSTQEIRRYWDNAAEISRAAHRQRMQAIEDRGAAARSAGNTYSDILDISHQGYLSRDSMTDQGQARSVRAAREVTLISNRETGEFYDVDGSNRFYWVDQDGTYLGTDNALFDPRQNPATREADWTRFHREK